MEPEEKACRACGSSYPVDMPQCPRCRVARGGDMKKRAVAAYGFFLLLMLIVGWFTLRYIGQ